MPYKKISDLPDSVKDHLPNHAQEIFMKAFNAALKEYQDSSKKRTSDSTEEVAFKVAWNAVKKKYKKSGDNWVAK